MDGAFDQLLRYQVHLKTPRLLIVSSFQTIRIQTNFPGMETARYDVGIRELDLPERLGVVRDAFFAPYRFRERLRSVDTVTRETASLFQSIVVDMEARKLDFAHSSGVSKGIDKPVVQSGRDFPYIGVGGGQ